MLYIYNIYVICKIFADVGGVCDAIWALASTLDPSVSKINEALSLAYKLLFILSKILFLAEVIAV